MSSWNISFRSLRKRRVRTILTVSGIIVGVAMIFVLLSLAAGFDTQARQLVQAIGGADLIVSNSTNEGGGGGFRFFAGGNTLNQSLVPTVSSISGVSTASPVLMGGVSIDGYQSLIVGIDPGTYSTVTGGLNIVSGSSITSSSGDQVVLGQTLAQNLAVTIGQTISLSGPASNATAYSVVGVFQAGGFSDRQAYVPLSDAQSVLGKHSLVSEILVKVTDPNLASTVSNNIVTTLSGVTVINPSNFTQTRSQLLNSLTNFFTILGLVALLGGSFGVVNTMIISVNERTREIGTLKALGARNSTVMRLFLSESLIIGIIGGVLGIVAGIIANMLVPGLTGGLFRLGGGGPAAGVAISPAITPYNLALSLGLGVAVGVIAGLYPAWRAARMNPVEALRHV